VPNKNLLNELTIPDIDEFIVTILPKEELAAKLNADNNTYIIPINAELLFLIVIPS